MNKKITVVVITYNHEKYLKKCIESILIQEGEFDLEILIGNDNSPDNTKEVLKEYEKNQKIQIINREKNVGPTKNILDLYKKAKGDYIALLEGDDFWNDSLKLKKQLEILEKNQNYSACITESYMVDEKNEVIGIKKIDVNEVFDLKQLFVVRGGIPTGTLLLRNYFFEMDSKIEELLTSGWMIGDLPLLSFLVEKGKIYNLKEKTSSYRYICKEGTSYSAMDNYKKNCELEKVVSGIKKYTGNLENKNFLNLYLNRLRFEIIKKDRKFFKNKLAINEKIDLVIYILFKPIYSLYYSCLKKKIKRGNL